MKLIIDIVGVEQVTPSTFEWVELYNGEPLFEFELCSDNDEAYRKLCYMAESIRGLDKTTIAGYLFNRYPQYDEIDIDYNIVYDLDGKTEWDRLGMDGLHR